jgi:hypothetical protein
MEEILMVNDDPYLLSLLLLTIAAYFTYHWIRELRFYHSNGWDFSKDSGCGIRWFAYRRGTDLQVPTTTRIKIHYPLASLGPGVPGLIVLISSLVRDYG